MQSGIFIHDRHELGALLRREPDLHLYEIGDLDDAFWPNTVWFGLPDRRAIAMLYTGVATPALLAHSREERPLRELLSTIAPVLPRSFHANLTSGIEALTETGYRATTHGAQLKMTFTQPGNLPDPAHHRDVFPLTHGDLEDVEAFYAAAYPGSWFTAPLLASGQYVGIRDGGRLVAVAGVHTYSPTQRVAVLGNIATHPDFRNRGLAARAVAGLCRQLLPIVDHIGLNVRAENTPAITVYERLGFIRSAVCHEVDFSAA